MPDQTLLGFDFGLRCIGVAVGQTLIKSATPLTVLPAKQGIPNWQTILHLIQEWGATALVVGMPCQMDGSLQTIAQKTQQFSDELSTRFSLPVYLADERLTTKIAHYELREKKDWKNQRMDSYAAKLILETWMDDNKDIEHG